jgi:phage gp29-like protein
MGRLGDSVKVLLGKAGVTEEDLRNEEASAVANSNRSPWSSQPLVSGLTPGRLGEILASVRHGEVPAEYLELAQEIERRDLHYRSVLSTRKHSVESLELQVEAGGEDEASVKIADAVRSDIMRHPDIRDLMKNSLDALGKGFAVSEIAWDTSGERWKPAAFAFKDPRWFAYDKADSRRLCLRAPLGNELTPLRPFLYVIHEPLLLSGPQILSGLAYTALFMWLVKSFDVTSWAAFVDRFGYPVRLGKYGKKATKEDIATLKRAVAAIGSDVGAVVPDSMIIDIVEAKTTAGSAKVYQDLAEWCDKQLSKLVLGQTASAEGTPGSLGNESGREEVRQDIIEADAIQLEKTLNRDLVRPYVLFNFNEQAVYPRLVLRKIEAQDVKLVVDSVQKLGSLGLTVKAQEVRDLLGLAKPEKGDEVIGGMRAPAPPESGMNRESPRRVTALNAAAPGSSAPEDGQAAAEDELLAAAEGADFIEISDEIAAVLEEAAAASANFEEFKARIEALVVGWPPDKVAELVAITTFKARAMGDGQYSRD